MDKLAKYFFDYAEAEFDGESLNGPSLMKTLDGLSAEAAASTATWEGYSAWSVALHVAYFKHYILRSVVGDGPAGLYPYPKGAYGFGLEPEGTEAAWAELRAFLRTVHRRVMDALAALPPERWEEHIPKWDIPIGAGAAWLFGHDSYHTAQIRSMGVPGLKEKREGS